MKQIIIIIIINLLFLTGCGFSPLYSSKSKKDNIFIETSKIKINPIDGIKGQILRNELYQELAPYGIKGSKYILDVSLAKSKTNNQVYDDFDNPTYAAISKKANFCLKESNNEKNLFCDNVVANSSFDISDSIYTVNKSKDYVENNIIKILTKDIADRIRMYYKTKK